jgi:hypothetical protein
MVGTVVIDRIFRRAYWFPETNCRAGSTKKSPSDVIHYNSDEV